MGGAVITRQEGASLVLTLAVLENWCDGARDQRRVYWAEKTDLDPEKPWQASAAHGQAVTSCEGRTMVSALADLAQVVLSSPELS